MPSSKSTILFLAALAVVGPVAMSQPANALQAMGPPPVRRAEHIQLAHKMTRKRSPSHRHVPLRRQDNSPDAPGSGGAATSAGSSGINVLDPGSTDSPAATSRNTDPNIRPTTTPPPSRQTVASPSPLSSISPAVQSSTSTTATRPTTTTTAATSSSTSQQASLTSNTSIAPTTTLPLIANQASSTQSPSRSTFLVTSTSVASSAPEQTDKSKDEGASFLPRPVFVALIVAASCVVAAIVIWTIIRKWKFAASRRFEDRLEPVNWEPPATSGGLPMGERDPTVVGVARGNSLNSHHPRTSFGSSDATHLGGAAGRNMAGSGSVAPDFPPPHDFTAGPANDLAPGAGYADLQRGPSPAPSMNYGGYGQQFSTPNPYDTYDYDYQGAYDQGAYDQGAYGGVQQPPHNNGPGPHQF